MTIIPLLIIILLAAVCCWLVFKDQARALPPYQNNPCDQDCNQGRTCVCDKPEATELNPKATWPFPHGPKP